MNTSLGKTALAAPATNRLDRPIRLIANHVPRGAIYVDLAGIQPQYHVVVRRAVEQMVDLLGRKYAASPAIQVIEMRPPKGVSNAVIIGGEAFRTVDRARYDADMKALAGTPGCAIRSDGANVYIYAAPFNFAGPARGLANGIYTFLENNTDVIFANAEKDDAAGAGTVFDLSPSGDFDIVWGQDYRNVPPLKVWGPSGVPTWHNDRNRAARSSVWGNWDYAGYRGRSCNHWWGYGTGSDGRKGEPNETWGIGEDGKPMLPGCYTEHPCLIRVLEKAKEDYVSKSGFSPPGRDYSGQFPAGEGFGWNSYDIHGLWVEDTLKVCQCAECATPIRKDYFQPIYAPINDTWWREMYRWSQLNVSMGLYEYFLSIQARPWADVFKFDLTLEAEHGLDEVFLEGDNSPLCMMERWVVTRLVWEPQHEVADLRATFLQRTFREAAPDMERFFETFYRLVYRDYAPYKPMEFEDLNDFGRLALRTISARDSSRTVADDLNANLDAAAKNVKNPEAARLLARFREKWDEYMAAARRLDGGRLENKTNHKQGVKREEAKSWIHTSIPQGRCRPRAGCSVRNAAG